MSDILLNFLENPLKIFENQGFLLPICRNICYGFTLKTYITTGGGYEIALFKENV
jgi:hypothetical protein